MEVVSRSRQTANGNLSVASQHSPTPKALPQSDESEPSGFCEEALTDVVEALNLDTLKF